MLTQEIQKAQAAFESNGYGNQPHMNFRHFAEGWLAQTGVELTAAIKAVDSYIEAAEAEAALQYDEDYIDWLASVNSGIPMS